jgi:hypothetical protein
LKYAAQKSIEDDDFKRRKNKENAVEQNAELGKRYAENL